MTNGERIRAGLMTDQKIKEIWDSMNRSPKEWFEWLNKESDDDDIGTQTGAGLDGQKGTCA